MDRGYFQKAIVIITPIPFVNVFVRALSHSLSLSLSLCVYALYFVIERTL